MKSIKLANSPITYFISGIDHTEWILFIHAAFVNHNMFKSQFEYFHNKYNRNLLRYYPLLSASNRCYFNGFQSG